MKKLSSICFGCEPLGGTDSGDVDLDEIEKHVKENYASPGKF